MSNILHKCRKEPLWRPGLSNGHRILCPVRKLWPAQQEFVGSEGTGSSRVPFSPHLSHPRVPAATAPLRAWCLSFPWPGAAWDFPSSYPAGVNRACLPCGLRGGGAGNGVAHRNSEPSVVSVAPLLVFSMPGNTFHCMH